MYATQQPLARGQFLSPVNRLACEKLVENHCSAGNVNLGITNMWSASGHRHCVVGA